MEKEGETEKTSIYEQREDGSQTPYVSREMLPEVEGVAVIAEGEIIRSSCKISRKRSRHYLGSKRIR